MVGEAAGGRARRVPLGEDQVDPPLQRHSGQRHEPQRARRIRVQGEVEAAGYEGGPMPAATSPSTMAHSLTS
jgi:hypothetical protein